MSKFVANPEVLRTKGSEMEAESARFKKIVESIYEMIHEMINSDYVSPDARAIAAEIDSYREDLNQMAVIILRYGEFCINASNKVIKNQVYITDEIK